MFNTMSKKIKEYINSDDKNVLSVKINNVAMDLSLWTVGIFIGLLPAIVITLFYPNDEIKDLNLWMRLLSEIEIAYSFLSGVTILTIEQLYIKSVNEKVDKIMKSTKMFCIFFEIIFIGIYIGMKPFSVVEIEQRLGGSIVELNKWLIITSIILSVILFVAHSLPHSKFVEEEGEK